MKIATLLITLLSLTSAVGPSQYTEVSHFAYKWYAEADSQPQAFWVRAKVGNQQSPKYYKDLQAWFIVAKYSPNWKSPYPTIPGIGHIHLNPALIVFVDLNPEIRLVYRKPENGDEWMIWTKLPPLPPALAGTAYTFQLLCWEKEGPPNYSLSLGSGANLVIVPK